MATGWIGFWIAMGIVIATEEVIEYLRWRTRVLYDIKPKKNFWNRWK